MSNVLLVGRSNPTSPPPVDDTNPAGTAEAFPYVSTSSEGPADKLWILLPEGNEAAAIQLGIYTNGPEDDPDALLGAAWVNNFNVDGSWASADLAEAVSLDTNTSYWLAVLSTDTTLTFLDQDANQTETSQTSDQTDLTELPSTWTPGGYWETGMALLFAAKTV